MDRAGSGVFRRGNVIRFVTETGSTNSDLAAQLRAGEEIERGYLGVSIQPVDDDLADSLGAQSNKDFEGDFAFTYKLARSLCLLGAAAAEVVPVETIDTNFRDLQALRKRAIEVRRQGYRGMLAIHPAQVPVINEAFTPSEEEIAETVGVAFLMGGLPALVTGANAFKR